jgi:hypothetical protein
MFWTPEHWWTAGDVFPQDIADVTNACSKRKAGFLYGFFVPVRGCSRFAERFVSIVHRPP